MGRFRKFQGREEVDETFRPEGADKAKKVKHMRYQSLLVLLRAEPTGRLDSTRDFANVSAQ